MYSGEIQRNMFYLSLEREKKVKAETNLYDWFLPFLRYSNSSEYTILRRNRTEKRSG